MFEWKKKIKADMSPGELVSVFSSLFSHASINYWVSSLGAHNGSFPVHYLGQESGWKCDGWDEVAAMQIWKSQKQVTRGNKAGD